MPKMNAPFNREVVMPRDLYIDGTYLKNNPNWHLEESLWKANQVIKAIERNNLTLSSICEVGCGYGEILKILSEKFGEGISYTGYEISPQAFEVCSKKSSKNLNFYLKDLTEEKKAVFDLVMVLDVVEHIEDYYGFLRKLKEKGRYKIFHIPLLFCVKNTVFMSHIIKDRKSVGHIHCFSKEIALAVLEDIGYNIIDYFYINKHATRRNLRWQSHLLRLFRTLFYTINQDITVRILGGYSISIVAE